MEGVMPGWCDFMRACRTGHYILLPREEVISNSLRRAVSLMVAQVRSHIAGRPIPAERKMKSAVKRRGKVDLFGERYRARGTSSPRLRAVVSYINDNREVVLGIRRWEIATATRPPTPRWCVPSRRWGFAGLRKADHGAVVSAPRSPRRKKMRSTVTALSSDVNSSIDFCARRPSAGVRGPVAGRQPCGGGSGGGIAQRRAPGGDLRYRRLGDPRRIHRPVVQPYWPAGVRDEPHGL